MLDVRQNPQGRKPNCDRLNKFPRRLTLGMSNKASSEDGARSSSATARNFNETIRGRPTAGDFGRNDPHGEHGDIQRGFDKGEPDFSPRRVGRRYFCKAVPWLRKNAISREQLDHIFMIGDESIDVIAAMPGKGKRQQTIQAYVICGLRSFLGSGDAAFSDKQARDLCVKTGCYDSPNHATYMKDFGNWISGRKDSGWRLTNPGLNEAARLVKLLTEHSNDP